MLLLPRSTGRRSPAARRSAERGVLHGLSLAVFTVLIFGAIAYFALGRFPLTCTCVDGSTRKSHRDGFASPEKLCQALCKDLGGGTPSKGRIAPARSQTSER